MAYNPRYDYEKFEIGVKTPLSFSRKRPEEYPTNQANRPVEINDGINDRSPVRDDQSKAANQYNRSPRGDNYYNDRSPRVDLYNDHSQRRDNFNEHLPQRETYNGQSPRRANYHNDHPPKGNNTYPLPKLDLKQEDMSNHTYRDRQDQYFQSPRQQQQYVPSTYRAGRPDMGFPRDDIYVPYPQEPIRRRRNEYEQPPDIGYGAKPHPGWVLMLRFHKDGLYPVQRALTMAAKHIEADGGRILGIARSYNVRIREGGDAWVTFGRMRNFGGGQWDIQMSPEQDETNYCVLVVYYPSLTRAIQWFDSDPCFKQRDFPPPNNLDCIALPLNSSVDTQYGRTLVLTEYPKISHPEYFRDKFSIPTEDLMRTRYRASPYVVKTTSVPTDDPRQRVARHLRGSWIKRNSIITVSMFDSMSETHRYFTDPEYYKSKEAQDRVSAPTTVVMDLEDWRL